jgi:hypothetical protein
MPSEKRRHIRKPMNHAAWLVVGNSQLNDCVVADISHTGARLEVKNSDRIPERFLLQLSARGVPHRHCRIVWRAPRQVGVQFENRTAEPVADAPAESAKPSRSN